MLILVKSIACSNPGSLEILINKWIIDNKDKQVISIAYNIAVAVSPENNKHDPPEIASLYWAMIHFVSSQPTSNKRKVFLVDTDLSTRAQRVLFAMDLRTTKDLAKYIAEPGPLKDKFMKFRHCGQKTYEEIVKFINKYLNDA